MRAWGSVESRGLVRDGKEGLTVLSEFIPESTFLATLGETNDGV